MLSRAFAGLEAPVSSMEADAGRQAGVFRGEQSPELVDGRVRRVPRRDAPWRREGFAKGYRSEPAGAQTMHELERAKAVKPSVKPLA